MALAYQLTATRKSKRRLEPKKVLLCNTGRLGDAFLMTQMIPRLEGCEVGVLVAKEGRGAVEGCPKIAHLHEIEPWYVSSDAKGEKLRKWRHFQKEKKARKEEFASYDTVLFTNPHFCGLGPLFPNAYTVGFDSHADCRHYSKILPWNPSCYLSKVYEEVLDALGFAKGPMQSPWQELVSTPLIEGNYCVMHIGASDKTKDYSSKMWKEVYLGLKAKGMRVYFTGKGQRDQVEEVSSLGEENLCDQLSWLEFLRLLAHSKLVISVDTVALHVAAAFKRPLLALYRDAPDQNTWCPL